MPQPNLSITSTFAYFTPLDFRAWCAEGIGRRHNLAFNGGGEQVVNNC